MDCVIVQPGNDDLVASEPRVCAAATRSRSGRPRRQRGIFVHAEGFLGGTRSPNEFRFMATEVCAGAAG